MLVLSHKHYSSVNSGLLCCRFTEEKAEVQADSVFYPSEVVVNVGNLEFMPRSLGL